MEILCPDYITCLTTPTMGQRITVVISDENLKKLRAMQAKKIKESTASVSFSRVLNEALNKCLK